jgi:alpha-L-fucosidase
VILNSRMGGFGDYATPEQGIPTTAPKGAWELCLTMNRSWSMAVDASYKTTQELVHVLCECAGMGGNLLLNVSPLPDGTIFFEQKRLLLEIGAWMDVHGHAIHGTRAGLPATHFYGPSTVSEDGTKLYLFVFDKPWGEIAVKGLHNKVKAARVLGHEGPLVHRVSGGAAWAGVPGVVWLTVPAEACNPLATIVELELEGTLKVHHGEGQVITQN